MNNFQYLGLTVIGLLIFVNLKRIFRRRSDRTASIAWLLLLLVGAGAIVAPDETTRVARYLGIQRGADLLLYSSILAGLALSLFTFVRFRRLNRQTTLIVRQIAIENVKLPIDPVSIKLGE